MAYNKTTWIDDVTPLDAEHLNNMEDGIEKMYKATINGKTLSDNPSLTAADVGALPASTKIPIVDKKFSPTSANAQSGKAVAEAVATEQKRANTTFSNALKGSKSGSAILLDDVSPVTHEMGVKVRGKNLLSAMSLFPTITNNAVPIHFKAGQQYTISFTTTYTAWRLMFLGTDKNGTPFDNSSTDANKYISNMYTGATGRLQHTGNHSGNTLTFTCNEDCIITAIVFWNVSNETNKTYSDFQLELGTTATDYTPYVDLTAVKVKRCGKNLMPYPYFDSSKNSVGATITVNDDRSISFSGTPTSYIGFILYKGKALVKSGTFTLSVGNLTNISTTLFIYDGSGATLKTYSFTKNVTVNADDYPTTATWNITVARAASNQQIGGTSYPQIELGTAATDYEPYITPTEYTPTADGTVNGVTSLCPITTLMTDTEGVIIDCEYNRDINKAFAELQQAIISLGGNI